MKSTTVLACVLATSLLSAFGDEKIAATRPATAAEIGELFNLAVASGKKPERMRFVVDITVHSPAWTAEQIAAEVKAQQATVLSGVSPRARSDSQASLSTLSNAIAQSVSGTKLLHVQELYAGDKCRIEQTDETFLNHPTNGFHYAYVDIHDPEFSPYQSFIVNYQLHSALLTKDPAQRWRGRELWRASTLDNVVAEIVLLAVADTTHIRSARDLQLQNVLLSLKIDPQKVQQLLNNSNPNWHLEANEDKIGEIPVVHFKLEGGPPHDFANGGVPLSRVECSIGQESGKVVCFESSFTNQIGFYISSKREDFDSNGYPHKWMTIKSKQGTLVERLERVFKKIDLNAKFTDQEAFAPVFPTNYVVSDVTFGEGVILRNPHPEFGKPAPAPSSNKRTIILWLLAFAAVAPLCVAFFATKRKHFPVK
jgi:hypothetical protein